MIILTWFILFCMAVVGAYFKNKKAPHLRGFKL